MNKTHADQFYLEGLVQNDGKIINQIYKRYAHKVKNFILKNNGSEEDAGDIFQECLMDVYNQAKYKDLKLSCPFEPFFLLVCKRKWLNQLKKKSIIPVTNNEFDLLNIGEDVFAMAERVLEEKNQVSLFVKMFEKLSEKCKEVISLSLTLKHQEQIAELLGVSYGYLRKKKSECLAHLIQSIKKENKHGEV